MFNVDVFNFLYPFALRSDGGYFVTAWSKNWRNLSFCPSFILGALKVNRRSQALIGLKLHRVKKLETRKVVTRDRTDHFILISFVRSHHQSTYLPSYCW